MWKSTSNLGRFRICNLHFWIYVILVFRYSTLFDNGPKESNTTTRNLSFPSENQLVALAFAVIGKLLQQKSPPCYIIRWIYDVVPFCFCCSDFERLLSETIRCNIDYCIILSVLSSRAPNHGLPFIFSSTSRLFWFLPISPFSNPRFFSKRRLPVSLKMEDGRKNGLW